MSDSWFWLRSCLSREIEPHAEHGACLGFSLSLCPSPARMLSLSLKINKQLQPPPQISCHQLSFHPSTSWAGQFLSCSNIFHDSLLPLIMTKPSSLVFQTFYEVSSPSSPPGPPFWFSFSSQSLIDTPRPRHSGCLAVPLALLGVPGATWVAALAWQSFQSHPRPH